MIGQRNTGISGSSGYITDAGVKIADPTMYNLSPSDSTLLSNISLKDFFNAAGELRLWEGQTDRETYKDVNFDIDDNELMLTEDRSVYDFVQDQISNKNLVLYEARSFFPELAGLMATGKNNNPDTIFFNNRDLWAYGDNEDLSRNEIILHELGHTLKTEGKTLVHNLIDAYDQPPLYEHQTMWQGLEHSSRLWDEYLNNLFLTDK